MYIRETHLMQRLLTLSSFVCSDAQRISFEVIKTEDTNSLIDRYEKKPLGISRRKYLNVSSHFSQHCYI